ncbi:energy-coupling factor transporter ATPase [Saccharibacillus sp. JS10]|uniref:energy-coupling factor transporter ATPase n=1 Tax=Saccharibacillus sp. JS10 TaxID=2950552 RepID=UPI00210F021E|nr:energy-coupling factor transporter ATPase [Saccharibacillus sp. JS10]MCQ4085476.1 energy-coupling factor transporter ATPase [Saccharibacillus sp. JS10]
MLVFDHVQFYYRRGQSVLNEINFSIEQGEFVSVVGGNGSGKSTLAKLMNGLLVAKQGSVKLDSIEVSDPAYTPHIRQKIGLIFQNPEDQFITTNVTDEIVFGLENIRVPAEEMQERVDQALQVVGMTSFAQASPHELSGGQKQKIAIAAILAMRPKWIVFDEATSMLDPASRFELIQLMQSLHQRGITIIQITHHMDEVLVSERVLLLDQGCLIFDGRPDHFFKTLPLESYGLEAPFALRIHKRLDWRGELAADWKGRAASQWLNR